MAKSLESKGDHDGVNAWNEVADVIDLQQEKRPSARQEIVTVPSQNIS